MTKTAPGPTRDERFVAYLEELVRREDRAALAALRRGLGKPPGEAADAHRYILPWLAPGTPRAAEDAAYLVAALFAWHQGSWARGEGERGPTNLGASLARLARQVESDSIEKRFVALLNCHRDDLPAHLRHVVGLLKTAEVPVDWRELLQDLRYWDGVARRVQRRWARAFWDASAEAGATVETAEPERDEDSLSSDE